MLFAFLIWVLPRSAVVLAVALGQVVLFGFSLVAHAEPKYWLLLSLETRGYAALATAVLVLLILADVIVEVVASVKAAGAVAGLLAGVLLAVAVVVTAVPEAEAVPEIARETGVSVEEARILYKVLLFGVAVGVGFGMFISWLLAALLWWFLEPRDKLAAASASRHAGLLGRRGLPRPRLLPSRAKRRGASHGGRPHRLASIPKAEGKVGKG